MNKMIIIFSLIVCGLVACQGARPPAPVQQTETIQPINIVERKAPIDPCSKPWGQYCWAECFGLLKSCPTWTWLDAKLSAIDHNITPENEQHSFMQLLSEDVVGKATHVGTSVLGVVTSAGLAVFVASERELWATHPLLFLASLGFALFLIVVISRWLKSTADSTGLTGLFLRVSGRISTVLLYVPYWFYYRLRYRGEFVKIKTRNPIVRVKQTMRYDEHGAYVAHGNVRIYSDSTELKSLNPSVAIELGVKETLLADSVIEPIDDYPAFIGDFIVGDVVIGQFSRILYKGKTALMTATHVLKTHELKKIMINGPQGAVPLSRDYKVLFYAPVEGLDITILSVPSGVFSLIGVKQGTLVSRVPMVTSVLLYGYDDGKRSVSCGIAKPESMFRLRYGASTKSSWSGTPILDMRRRIIGVHTEGGLKYNVGSVLPSFRKESEWDGAAWTAAYEQIEEPDETLSYWDEDQMHTLMSKNNLYRYQEEDEQAFARLPGKDKIRDWGVYMEELDAMFAEGYHKYDTATIIGFNKETVYICAHCGLVQSKRKACERCDFALGLENTAQTAKKLLEPIVDVVKSTLPPGQAAMIIKALDIACERMNMSKVLVERIVALGNESRSSWQDPPSPFTLVGRELKPTIKELVEKVDRVDVTKEVMTNDLYPSLNQLKSTERYKYPTADIKETVSGLEVQVDELKSVYDAKTSLREGTLAFRPKIIAADPVEIKVVEPKLSLNSKGPSTKDGRNSQEKRKLVSPAASSSDASIVATKKASGQKRTRHGKTSPKNNPPAVSSPGPIEGLTQSLRALNSSQLDALIVNLQTQKELPKQ
jgi:hypothetical protein